VRLRVPHGSEGKRLRFHGLRAQVKRHELIVALKAATDALSRAHQPASVNRLQGFAVAAYTLIQWLLIRGFRLAP
jgi:hypothetical protein